MSSIKKRGKVYYGQWQKRINGRRVNNTKSLGVTVRYRAEKMMKKLDDLEEERKINPYRKDFDPKETLERLERKDRPVELSTVRDTADYFYKLKGYLSNSTVSGDQKPSKHGAYERAVEFFISFNDLENTNPRDVHLSHFETVIFRPNLAPATRHFYFKQLRTFWNALLERNIVDEDYFPILKKHLPKKKSKMRDKMLSGSELKQLFEAFDRELGRKRKLPEWKPYYAQQWFKPMIATYFYAGMRKHEAAFSSDISYSGLKGKNLFYEDETLAAITLEATKGRNERFIPVSRELRSYLERYINIRGKPGYEQYLFIYLGGPKKGWPVTGQRVYKQFKRYLKLAKLPKERTLHGMRHRRITSWLENGYNTSEAQFMAGHSSSSVTNRYTHLGVKKLLKKQQKLDE